MSVRPKALLLALLGVVVLLGALLVLFRPWATDDPQAGGPEAASGTAAPVDPALADLAQDALRAPLTGQTFYFVLPDRFANGDPGNDTGGVAGDRSAHGHDPSDIGYYHGGDLEGLRERLDYLEGLGVTAIWMTPVMTNQPVQGEGRDASAAYHGYWITDFTSVDPHLGTREDLEQLVGEAHARGMRVFLDVITNHTADVIDYQEGEYTYRPLGQDPYTPVFRSPQDASLKVPAWLNDPDNYHNRGNSTFQGESSLYGDFFGLDDLATERQQVVEGFVDVYTDWVDAGVDGFRIDTVKHVDLEFWKQWAPAVLEHARAVGSDDFFLFGEVFETSPLVTSPYTTAGGLPAVLDFGFQAAATDFVTGGPSAGMARFYAGDDLYTDADSNAASLPTFLGNHDMGRAATFYGSVALLHQDLPERVELAHSLMFLTRGQPVVYYGDEQGFVGRGGDKHARQDMMATRVEAWAEQDGVDGEALGEGDHFDTTSPLYRHLAELGRLRAEHPALAEGAQLARASGDAAGVFAVSRVHADEGIEHLVLVNNDVAPVTLTVPTATPGASWTSLLGDHPAVTSDGSGRVEVTVPAVDAVVLRADAPMPSVSDPLRVTVSGGELRGRAEIRAEVEGADRVFAQVTFAYRTPADPTWTVLGTDDAPPYRVHPDTASLPEGEVELAAVVKPWQGPVSAATSSATVVPPAPVPDAGTGPPAPGQPALVVVAGTFQAAAGCPGDWDPACPVTALSFDERAGTWSGELDLPPGGQELKIALSGSWEENYGQGGARDGANIRVDGGGRVRVTYDHDTHEVSVEPADR